MVSEGTAFKIYVVYDADTDMYLHNFDAWDCVWGAGYDDAVGIEAKIVNGILWGMDADEEDYEDKPPLTDEEVDDINYGFRLTKHIGKESVFLIPHTLDFFCEVCEVCEVCTLCDDECDDECEICKVCDTCYNCPECSVVTLDFKGTIRFWEL